MQHFLTDCAELCLNIGCQSLGLRAGTTFLMSFFPCLYLIWMYIFLFLPNPLSLLSISVFVSVSLSTFVSVRLSFYVFFPLSPPSSVDLCVLSLTLVVSTFGENLPGAPLGKSLPLSSTLSSPLVQIGFSLFLSCYDYSCSFTLSCPILNDHKQKPPQILKCQQLEFIELIG